MEWNKVAESLRDASKRRLDASLRRAWNSSYADRLAIRDEVVGSILAAIAEAIEAGAPATQEPAP